MLQVSSLLLQVFSSEVSLQVSVESKILSKIFFGFF